MKCLRNKNHKDFDDFCSECIEKLHPTPQEPDLNDVCPSLRALFTQLTLQNRDYNDCWPSSYKNLNIAGARRDIKNVYYSFFKGDVGTSSLKQKCISRNCVNPAHHKSQFEQEHIETQVVVGFNREKVQLRKLSPSRWLTHV